MFKVYELQEVRDNAMRRAHVFTKLGEKIETELNALEAEGWQFVTKLNDEMLLLHRAEPAPQRPPAKRPSAPPPPIDVRSGAV